MLLYQQVLGQRSEKIVLNLTIFIFIIESSIEADSKVSERSELQRVSDIYYLTKFDEFFVKVIINLDCKVYAMQLNLAKKLNIYICTTKVKA